MFEEKTHRVCPGRWLAVAAVPTLFVAVLTLGYVGVLPLRVEAHTLGIVGFIFLVFVGFVRHNALYAVCQVKASFSQMEQALRKALEEHALTIMGQTKSTLRVRAFMGDYYRSIRNDNVARVAPTVFPMLGILGTFIAIAVSMPDFSADNLDALDREISVLLSGIGTAFYASIYGIMLSLVWIFFEKRGLSTIDKLIDDMEVLYDKHIWKEAELLKHEHMQTALRDQEIVKTLRETFNVDFIREMNEQYLTRFTAIVTETTKQFKTVAAHLHSASEELRHTLERIEKRKKQADAALLMRENIEAFNASAQRLEILLGKWHEGIETTFETFDKELAHSVERIGLMGRLLSEQNQRMLEMLRTMKQEQGNEDV